MPLTLLVVIVERPRPVVPVQLESGQHASSSDSRRCRGKRARPALAAAADFDDRPIEEIHVVHVHRTSRREISLLGVVRALLELHAADELGDEKVRVGVAMAVAVRRHVHRNTGNRGREVGPVIEIESAQVVLIGFSLSAVLADDQSRNGLEHLTGPHDRPIEDLLRRNRPFTRRAGDADEIRRPDRSTSARLVKVCRPVTVTSAVNVSRRTVSSETD